jgi:hypothetical protein
MVSTYLEWITISVFRHLRYHSAAVTQLTHFATTPCVKIALLITMAHIIEQKEFKISLPLTVICLGDFLVSASSCHAKIEAGHTARTKINH